MRSRHIPLLAFVASAAAFSPAPDSPYEELVSLRRPLSGAWQKPPTGWVALPCSALRNSSTSSPSIAASSGSAAVFICFDAFGAPLLTSAASGDVLDVDASVPPAALASGVLAGSPTLPSLFLLVPGSYTLYTLQCAATACAAVTTTLLLRLPPIINATVVYPSSRFDGWSSFWATGDTDTVAFDISPTGDAVSLIAGPFGWGGAAIAYSYALGELAIGNATKLSIINDTMPTTVVRWEWVSDTRTGDGGVYSDAITALAFDDKSGGILYVGTPTSLDVRYANHSVVRVAPRAGLPWGNITALAMDTVPGWLYSRVWIGTNRGVILYDPTSSTNYGAPGVPLRQKWRYMYGSRYLASTASDYFDGVVLSAGLIADGTASMHVLTSAGLTTLTSQQWTLAAKASLYESAVPRHMRLGQMCSCDLTSFGVTDPCNTGPDDNNGLWTSLLVVAAAMQYSVTGSTAARDLAWRGFEGMHLLMRATDIKGLISRSVLAPGSTTGSGTWYNSTVPGLENYLWKGDASSDEVCGHLLAYPFVANIVEWDNAANASVANGALLDLARYITSNGYRLIDITGNVTTWGHWDPPALNGDRSLSDVRGLNSIQMLALLAAGLKAAPNASDPDNILFTAAWEDLRKAGYVENMLNAKIATANIQCVSDCIYHHISISVWAHVALLFNSANGTGNGTLTPSDVAMASASLSRTWYFLRPLRSALWNSLAVGSGQPADDQVVADTVWNLRTWPLELVDWPVQNTHRLDIYLDPDLDRMGQSGDDSLDVLPANERSQDRWNGNPHDLNGGSGFSEDDPSAFLLSYWAARWAGLLLAP